ncbi:protein UPSTREAM OF FLC [Abrus precatorius]|uniref:Protein UPSTREAM OF FLC n=1 Tax=Abrus precatorius TaxID=3816 RepID=A0A8B8KGY9_ABRPR|nr:protein UPSTREAM OF FLC [Abrus precatorius]
MEAKGGEVRRLHIVYFLSHIGGHADHPHLIRVLHLARNGVYLRDVKRWLGELRGRDLPEAFAWSYKRRYKTGYVWQDLLDDDLITPISDNEYVLKGSQIHPTPYETRSLNEKKSASDIHAEKKCPRVQVVEDKQQHQKQPSLAEEPHIQLDPDSKTDTPTKGSSEISQDSLVFSSDRSSMTDDDSSKVEEEKLLETTGKEGFNEQNREKLETCSLPSLYHNQMTKKGENRDDKNKTHSPDSSLSTMSSPSFQSSFTKIRSNSTRVSSVFRNLITCGIVETNDAALVRMNQDQKIFSKEPNNNTPGRKAEICKGDKLGGSARCFGTSWNHHHHKQYGARKSFDGEETSRSRKLGELMNQTTYKPFGGPTCSLCGKSFKPENMYKHMKSCKGMKALGISTTSDESFDVAENLVCVLVKTGSQL